MKGQLALKRVIWCKCVPLLILKNWICLRMQLEGNVFQPELVRNVVNESFALLVKNLYHVITGGQNHVKDLVVLTQRHWDLTWLVEKAFERCFELEVCSFQENDESCRDREFTPDFDLEIRSGRPSIYAFNCELAFSNQTKIAILVSKRFLLVKVSLITAVEATLLFSIILLGRV